MKVYVSFCTSGNLIQAGSNERAEFYLNQSTTPVLVVEDMKHGVGQKGSVGVFVDIGTEAIISELKVTCTD